MLEYTRLNELTQERYSAWYWQFVPHYRAVEDEQALEVYTAEDEVTEQKAYEYRDEADRKWYSFFNEYEYRYPKSIAQTKNSWAWFDQNNSPRERKLVCKLDLLIVSFAVISYWAKNLDQSNLANAYVSGMKEELGMDGDDYSNTVALFNAGTVIFQIFYMYMFPRVPMHYMFFLGDVLWSIFTLIISGVSTVGQLQVCRFFVGSFEAGYFMMIHYLLGSWYKPDELGRRGGLFYTGQMIGAITSGQLQAAIYTYLDGSKGLSGWRWMFLIDGIITIPIGILALYMVPGTPYNCHSLFLTDEDIKLARKRLRDANITPPSKDPPPFFNKQLWKNILTSWRVYVLMILDALFWQSSNNGCNGFALWMKSLDRYSTPHLNRLTSIPPALGIVFIISVCFSADFIHSRTIAITWGEIINFSGSLILSIWNVPEFLKWYAFFIGYFGITISSVVYAWINDVMRHDPQERAIVLCICNMFSNQFSAWLGTITYPTSHAPEFHRGYTYTSCIDATLIVWVWITSVFYKRQERKDSKINGIILYNSNTGVYPIEAIEHFNPVSTSARNSTIRTIERPDKKKFVEISTTDYDDI